jgi:hypothetical protein
MPHPGKAAIAKNSFRIDHGAPKPVQRKVTKASKYELQCRKAHEDAAEARKIARLYDEPCDVKEFS